MKINEVTVTYSFTQSMPEYCNVKPGVTYRAEVAPDEDPETVADMLWTQAKHAVHQYVDEAMEDADVPPRFWNGDRWNVWRIGS